MTRHSLTPDAISASDTLRPWGYHLVLDCAACEQAAVRDPARIAAFSRDLIARIDMKAYGEPMIEHFAEHTPEAAGYSLLQLIETSNIAGHFSDLTGDAYLDIFSCKPFDPEAAKTVVREHFSPAHIEATFLTRRARHDLVPARETAA